EAEQFKLDGVHQAMKQGALGHRFVEYDDIEKGHGVHVSDFRQVRKAQGSGLVVKRRVGNAGSVEFDDLHALKHVERKVPAHERFLVLGEHGGGMEVVFTLLAEKGRDQIDGFEDTVFAQPR